VAGATFGRSRGTGIDGAGAWTVGSAGIVDVTGGGSEITGPLPAGEVRGGGAGGSALNGATLQPADASRTNAVRDRSNRGMGYLGRDCPAPLRPRSRQIG
jgi:hypothetical protein